MVLMLIIADLLQPTIIIKQTISIQKTFKRLGSQNEHSDIASKYSSNLKMTHVVETCSYKL